MSTTRGAKRPVAKTASSRSAKRGGKTSGKRATTTEAGKQTRTRASAKAAGSGGAKTAGKKAGKRASTKTSRDMPDVSLVDDATLRRQLARLDRLYPDADCALIHDSPFQLLIATMLSAQTTDKAVNKITPALFARFPTPKDLAEATQEEVEAQLRTIGLFRNKARNIRNTARLLVERHGGEVPRTMEELVALPGVARKTANVVLGVAFGIADGIVVDTHVLRLSNRLGFVRARTPVQAERALMARIPKPRWIRISHQLILHGRAVCSARRPACERCALAPDCPSADVG